MRTFAAAQAAADPFPRAIIDEVRVGCSDEIGDSGIRSAIVKAPVTTRVSITDLGIEGDEQAALNVHGGPDRAVLVVDSDHYARWRDDYPHAADAFQPGSFGENLVVSGMAEDVICIGDILRAGTALLQVTQPRSPCYKLDHRLGIPGLARIAQANGRTGWLCRVLAPGSVAASDTLAVIERPHPEWTVRRMQVALYDEPLDLEAAAAIVELPPLAERVRRKFERRLATGQVEDNESRLAGPGA